MTSQSRGLPLVRRVFGRLFGPAAPPPGSSTPLQARLELMAASLTTAMLDDPSRGFVGASEDEVHAVARRLAWQRWRRETGRLTDAPIVATKEPAR